MVRRMWEKLSRYPAQLYDAEHAAADALALARLAPIAGEPLPWTKFSMRPTAIEAAVSDILLNSRLTIVECGSGNSTVFMARLLSRVGKGHVTSLDHEREWAQLTTSLLEREGLSDWATVIHAPLVEGWYDRAAIPTIENIDLLIVDGPPADTAARAESRYPAWPQFAPSFAPGAAVLVDDLDRPGEQAVLARWRSEFGAAHPTQEHSFAVIRT